MCGVEQHSFTVDMPMDVPLSLPKLPPLLFKKEAFSVYLKCFVLAGYKPQCVVYGG